MGDKDNLTDTKKLLKGISPSFCAAKWTQVTLHLESGQNHSCHHPKTHLTPLSELKKNPAALHNTQFKLERRKEMMGGVRPKECSYCWTAEDLKSADVLSDRILKSSSEWSKPYISKILEAPQSVNFLPTYLEVSFSNICNLKCSYCSANFSSSWKKEIDKHGAYSTLAGELTNEIWEEELNPYIAAFWSWWPELKKNLTVLRITGGEPLLSKNTYRLLNELQKEPQPNLELAINSNLAVSHGIVQRFVEEIKKTVETARPKRIMLYVSLESVAKKAEYIRNGLDYELFLKNLEYILQQCPFIGVTIMSTFGLMSVTSYKDFLQMVLNLNKKWSRPERPKPIWVDISYLKNPTYLSVQILPYSFEKYFHDIRQFLEHNRQSNLEIGFDMVEILKFERVYEIFMAPRVQFIEADGRRQFYMFVTEHDQRRDCDFLETFPEYASFWTKCRKNFYLGVSHRFLRKMYFDYQRVKRRAYDVSREALYRAARRNG